MKHNTTTWPDTTDARPPADHPHGVALWLLGRHPQLADLVDRLPDVAGIEDGQVFLNLDELAKAFTQYDAYLAAKEETFGWSSPSESSWARFEAAQPTRTAAADELMAMSGSELGRLRLLATLTGTGVRFSVLQLNSFDAAGKQLLEDWLDAVRQG
jgi:hypothetical protein